jgi:hypothetical protein
MRSLSLCLLALCLAGCGAEPAPRAPGATETGTCEPRADVPPGSTSLAAPGDLVGEYRVAGIDGAELAGDFGVALSIDGPRLSFEPTCAGFVWRIEAVADALRFVRVPQYPATAPGGQPAPVCAVAVPPQLRQLGEAIDAGERAWRTPANGVLIEGGGRSVLLFSQ